MAVSAPARHTFTKQITSKETLRAMHGEPSEAAVKKQLAALDDYCVRFIGLAPFLLMGTSGPNGVCDVSPKGDAPGFVAVIDEKTIAIPDRPGNRRLDSLMNIVDNPHIGLLFLIPGINETLRVNGRATLVQDDELLDRLAVDGRRPNLATVVEVEECFLHCPKAFLRSKLWDPASQTERDVLPSLGRMTRDQSRPPGRTDAEHERIIAEAEAASAWACEHLYEWSTAPVPTSPPR